MYIFIGYSNDKINNKHGKDYNLVSAVQDRFKQMTVNGEGNFETFLADQIELGEDYQNKIEDALLKTDSVLLFISENSCCNENDFVREINAIRKKHEQKEIAVVSVCLDESLPPVSIEKTQVVMWTEEDKISVFDEKFNKILHKLGIAPNGESEPIESAHDEIWSYITLGDFARSDKKMGEAIENYNNALEIARKEANKNESADTLHDLGSALQRLGSAYEIAQDMSNSKRCYEECLEIIRKNAEKYPSYKSDRDFSVCLNKMGNIALKENDIEKAKEYYTQSLEKDRENAKKYPSYKSNRDLSISLGDMGDIALKENNVAKAKEFYEESLGIRRENAQECPSYESFFDLSTSYVKTALAEKADKNYDKAEELFENALEYSEKCLKICQCKESVMLCMNIEKSLKNIPRPKFSSIFKRK